jgi:hypothetical protein
MRFSRAETSKMPPERLQAGVDRLDPFLQGEIVHQLLYDTGAAGGQGPAAARRLARRRSMLFMRRLSAADRS